MSSCVRGLAPNITVMIKQQNNRIHFCLSLVLLFTIGGGWALTGRTQEKISSEPLSQPQAESKPTLSQYQIKQLPAAPDLPLRSAEGREIKIYQIGSGENEYVFLFGTFHGDEPQGQELLERLMPEFIQKSKLIADKTIFVIPVVNPDGLARKTRFNFHKVDLNRNFNTGNFIPNQNPGTRYYSGKQPLSEPESKIIEALLRPYLTADKKPRLKILSIHAPLKMNNYDGPAEALAKEMSRHNKLPPKADIGYPTPGSFGSFYGKELKIPVVTLETGYERGEILWKHYRESLWTFVHTVLPESLSQKPSLSRIDPPILPESHDQADDLNNETKEE